MYWHILENSPSELLSRAFTELKSIVDKTTSSCNNSWYSNLLFYSDNLGGSISCFPDIFVMRSCLPVSILRQ
jgi:hypothetical protein